MLRSLRAFALCAAFVPMAVHAQTHRPTDHQVLIQVSRTLATEPAFNGMTIIPSVSHGVVTLTGNVTSYAAKVLASTEIANINGVKTVLNNLNVVPAGSEPQPTASEPSTPPPPSPAQDQNQNQATASDQFASMRSLNVPAGTVLPVRLVEQINTKTAQANDPFHATLLSDITHKGYVLIPRGTVFVGRVISAKAAGRFAGYPELSLELISFTLNTPQGQQQMGLITDPLSSEGKGRGKNTAVKAGGGAALGAIIGALAGGGEGAAIGALSGGALGAGTNIRRGQEIVLQPEQRLDFKVQSPAAVPVYLNQDGQQIIPKPATTPQLLPAQNNNQQQ
uniref:BON domain-containing protein n=1 Tax=Acidobacterium capsulatum TaxID=33075 RepID=A0A7V4XRI1_9BACT